MRHSACLTLCRSSLIALPLLAQVTPSLSDTRITENYLYIGIEAESHVLKNDRWILTEPTTPNNFTPEEDHDGNHSDQASGSTYLELLPDTRVTHSDPLTADNYWGAAGIGPQIDYEVNIPEPGRYYVHVRAYSTGTEDNGIHVGLNGIWPDSGERMQLCSASRKSWWWSSAQRDSGGNGSCGAEKTIYLDVQTAGLNTVSFSAREDGFEIDQFVLIKDLSGNTKVCSPVNVSDVTCRNGSIEEADDFVDLRLNLNVEPVDPENDTPVPVLVGDTVEVHAVLENLDGYDTATLIEVELMVDASWDVMTIDSRCSQDLGSILCLVSDQAPTSPNENETFVFTFQALDAGELSIDGVASAAEVDSRPDNDASNLAITVEHPVINSDLGVSLLLDKTTVTAGTSVVADVTVSNVGPDDAEDVVLMFSAGSGMSVVAASPDCGGISTFLCNVDSLPSGGSMNFQFTISAAEENEFMVSAAVSGSSSVDAVADNNSSAQAVQVNDVVTEPTGGDTIDNSVGDSGVESGGDTGGAKGGVTTGGTDTGTTGDDAAETDNGALSPLLILLGLLVGSARLYRGHKRQFITGA